MLRDEIDAHNSSRSNDFVNKINNALHVGRGHPVLDPVPMNSKPGLLVSDGLSSSFMEQVQVCRSLAIAVAAAAITGALRRTKFVLAMMYDVVKSLEYSYIDT